MIKITSSRITTEDKDKEYPEIYTERIDYRISILGITIFKRSGDYESTPVNASEAKKKIGFRKSDAT